MLLLIFSMSGANALSEAWAIRPEAMEARETASLSLLNRTWVQKASNILIWGVGLSGEVLAGARRAIRKTVRSFGKLDETEADSADTANSRLLPDPVNGSLLS